MKHLAIAGAAGLIALAAAAPAAAFDPADAARIQTLVDTGMEYYWSGGDVKKAEAEVFKGITLHGRYDVVEQAFAEAAELAPERIDFRFGVASSQILQKQLDEAAAPIGRSSSRTRPRSRRRPGSRRSPASPATRPRPSSRTRRWRRWTASAPRPIASASGAPRRSWPSRRTSRSRRVPGDVTIVTLGYALADDGTAEPTLIDRLEVALAAAEANPRRRSW